MLLDVNMQQGFDRSDVKSSEDRESKLSPDAREFTPNTFVESKTKSKLPLYKRIVGEGTIGKNSANGSESNSIWTQKTIFGEKSLEDLNIGRGSR